jgi:hypothetical protein
MKDPRIDHHGPTDELRREMQAGVVPPACSRRESSPNEVAA